MTLFASKQDYITLFFSHCVSTIIQKFSSFYLVLFKLPSTRTAPFHHASRVRIKSLTILRSTVLRKLNVYHFLIVRYAYKFVIFTCTHPVSRRRRSRNDVIHGLIE